MSNELKIFENAEFGTVRTTIIDNDPWFVAVDACKALDLSNPSDILKRLDDDEKMTLSLTEGHSGKRGGAQMVNIVNEPGLYTLVLRSRKPQAKAFKRWITHDVIPSIRKHGVYATSDTIDKIIADPEYGIKLLQALKDERDKTRVLTNKVKDQSRQIEVMKPKATYYDIVLSCKDAVAISQISKDYGMSAQQMNKILYKHGVQYKRGNTWLLYQKYADKGYTKTQTRMYTGKDGVVHPYIHTCWTQKGRMFIYEVMKKEGIFPMIEQELNAYVG